MQDEKRNKINRMAMFMMVLVLFIAGCSNGPNGNETNNAATPAGTANSSQGETQKETPYIEVWGNHGNFKNAIEKDSPYSKWMVEKTGVGYTSPLVPWEGGASYIQRLNTRIASNDLPDVFLPWGGIEGTLINQGALADLTEYLPEYAPNIWSQIPEDIWNVVRTSDPTGEGKIYYIPRVELYEGYGAFIRQDWLDRVDMKVPQTKEELETVFQAFLDQDANGNGDPNDEIPISGREFGRWMDVLFGMYGVAMWEGFPMWDLYEGEITYSGVSSNMRAAIVNLREMYEKGFLDNETFLNKAADWTGKINADRVGSWFHINKNTHANIESIYQVNPDVQLTALPVPKVEGYEGFTTQTRINRPEFVIANKGEETIINALKILDWFHDPANREDVIFGIEGIDHKVENGQKIILPQDFEKNSAKVINNFIFRLEDLLYQLELERGAVDEQRASLFQQREQILIDNQPYAKIIAGEGVPSSVYEGYADIQNHTLYQEVMTKIIIGDEPIERFDKFVEEWHQSGGQVVTDRVRQWYAKVK
ncbi:extracellular solute-binding protein [Paenibacillus agaridevorans]|uniref:extracellular solute-binding protein n=1 Tax=Paenibacillus agaridevorans TaxID=171404 RepID=UPI001BE4DB9E|nr:extracellular solute-binding protein [Paenibacillus agaridevorans]